MIRKIGFWMLDFIKGGKIYKHYKDIQKDMKNYDANVQMNKVNKLLKHAVETTEFYKNQKYNNIKDFPVVNKLIYKENFDKFQSEKYKNEKLHKMSTSGSTGTPFVVNQNMNKRYRTLADIIYFNQICGQNLGDKYIYFRVWTDKNRKSKFEQWKQNLIPIDISHLDDESLENIRNFLKNNRFVNSTLAYASTYEMLVKYIERKGDISDNFHIKTMISSSEVLSPEIKRKIKNIIGADVVDRYSNQENGIIAQTYRNEFEFHVNTSSYYVELLKLESDEEAEDGELARIVITDLYNYAMPMIRYDTGDLTIAGDSKDNKVIKEIFGRKIDMIYDANSKLVSPHMISINMWGIKGIKQFKFIQYDKAKYKILLNLENHSICDEKEIEDKFKQLLGEKAQIDIEFTNEIPVLSSGKRKYIENLYSKNTYK